MKARALSGTWHTEQRGFLRTHLIPSTGRKGLAVWVGLGRRRLWGLVRRGAQVLPRPFYGTQSPGRDGKERRAGAAPEHCRPSPQDLWGPVLSWGRASREVPCRRTVALEGLLLAGGPAACRRSPPSCPSALQHQPCQGPSGPSEVFKGPSCWSQRDRASHGLSRGLRAVILGPPQSPALTGPPPDCPVRPGCRALSPVSVEFLSVPLVLSAVSGRGPSPCSACLFLKETVLFGFLLISEQAPMSVFVKRKRREVHVRDVGGACATPRGAHTDARRCLWGTASGGAACAGARRRLSAWSSVPVRVFPYR